MREQTREYSLADIIEEGMKRFHVAEGKKDGSTSKVPEKFVKKFKAYLASDETKDEEGRTLWDRSEDKGNPRATGNLNHFFTEEEKDQILSSPAIYRYMRKHSGAFDKDGSGKFATYAEMVAEVDEIHDRWRQMRTEEPWMPESYTPSPLTDEEYVRTKNQIMIEALYGLFFEDIDVKMLHSDMEKANYYGGDTETISSLQSKERLKNLNNYVVRSAVGNTLREDVADQIAEKVANKISDKLVYRIAKMTAPLVLRDIADMRNRQSKGK